MTLTSGLNSMDITAFNVDSSTVSLDGNWDDFYVGGTLSVASGQAAGTYTGTFSVSVEYQ